MVFKRGGLISGVAFMRGSTVYFLGTGPGFNSITGQQLRIYQAHHDKAIPTGWTTTDQKYEQFH